MKTGMRALTAPDSPLTIRSQAPDAMTADRRAIRKRMADMQMLDDCRSMDMLESALVTGADRFIGTHLVEAIALC